MRFQGNLDRLQRSFRQHRDLSPLHIFGLTPSAASLENDLVRPESSTRLYRKKTSGRTNSSRLILNLSRRGPCCLIHRWNRLFTWCCSLASRFGDLGFDQPFRCRSLCTTPRPIIARRGRKPGRLL
jgi:hypothetical protein